MTRVQDFQAFIHLFNPSATYDFVGQRWYSGPHIHGSPVAWDVRPTTPFIYVYAWAEKDRLKRLRFDPSVGKFDASDAVDALPGVLRRVHGDLTTAAPGGMPGGILSLSSNGASNGIIWATVEEPFKFCNKLDPSDGHGSRVLVDQPFDRGDAIPACDILGGCVPGRLYAFTADVDPTDPAGANRLKAPVGRH